MGACSPRLLSGRARSGQLAQCSAGHGPTDPLQDSQLRRPCNCGSGQAQRLSSPVIGKPLPGGRPVTTNPSWAGMMTGSSACTGNAKYDAAADFVLPDLVGAGGRVERPTAGRLGPRRDICWVWGSADHPGSKLGQLDEGHLPPRSSTKWSWCWVDQPHPGPLCRLGTSMFV